MMTEQITGPAPVHTPMQWPPGLPDLKRDMGVADDRDDAQLLQVLDAATAFVQRVKLDRPAGPPAPATQEIILGTLRLAGRWHTRRRSPDALITMAELGAARVPSFDPDIEQLLSLGRYAGPVIA